MPPDTDDVMVPLPPLLYTLTISRLQSSVRTSRAAACIAVQRGKLRVKPLDGHHIRTSSEPVNCQGGGKRSMLPRTLPPRAGRRHLRRRHRAAAKAAPQSTRQTRHRSVSRLLRLLCAATGRVISTSSLDICPPRVWRGMMTRAENPTNVTDRLANV